MDTKKFTTSTFKTVLNEKELNKINGGFNFRGFKDRFDEISEKPSFEKLKL